MQKRARLQVVPPIGKDPLLGLPTPVPLPRLERLYFKCGPWRQCCRACQSIPQRVTLTWLGRRHMVGEICWELALRSWRRWKSLCAEVLQKGLH